MCFSSLGAIFFFTRYDVFFEVMKQSIFFPYFGALYFLASDVPHNGEL